MAMEMDPDEQIYPDIERESIWTVLIYGPFLLRRSLF